MILLTVFKCEILGLDWNLEHTPTLKAILGRLVVKYKRQPIMLLYNVTLTDSPKGLLVNFVLVAIGVLACAAFSSPNLLTRFLAYLLCWYEFQNLFASPAIQEIS